MTNSSKSRALTPLAKKHENKLLAISLSQCSSCVEPFWAGGLPWECSWLNWTQTFYCWENRLRLTSSEHWEYTYSAECKFQYIRCHQANSPAKQKQATTHKWCSNHSFEWQAPFSLTSYLTDQLQYLVICLNSTEPRSEYKLRSNHLHGFRVDSVSILLNMLQFQPSRNIIEPSIYPALLPRDGPSSLLCLLESSLLLKYNSWLHMQN